MPDPAVEAAQRAWEARYPTAEGFSYSLADNGVAAIGVAAAREMAMPIRALSQELRAEHLIQNVSEQARERYLGVEYVLEKLAPLIYATEELS